MSKLKVTTISDPDNNNTALTVASDGKVTLAQDTIFNGDIGIGTSSPAAELHIQSDSPEIRFTDNVTTTNSGKITYLDSRLVIQSDDDNQMGSSTIEFQVDGTERMRIDSSGNLLVGTTNSIVGVGNTNAGVSIRSVNGSFLSRTPSGNDATLTLNRNSSDGVIANFNKDGTTVGSIGTYSNDLYIGNNDSGLRFEYAGLNAIVPFDVNSTATSDAQTDLGYSNSRFKNLYLSGGAYIGGTGSANYLDDYEEGTWTPTLTGSVTDPTVTYNNDQTYGYYTAVGRIVHARGSIVLTAASGGSGNLEVSGLPFLASSNINSYPSRSGGVTISQAQNMDSGTHPNTGQIQASDSYFTFRQNTPTSGTSNPAASDLGSSTILRFAVTYFRN